MSFGLSVVEENMPLQEGVFAIQPEEFSRVVEVWEASVRATHHFVTEANIQFFKPCYSRHFL